MPHYFAALTLIVLIGMVFTRVLLMKAHGIEAIKFGDIDKKDFLIPPFALFYFYIIFAEAFPLPAVSSPRILPVGFLPLDRSGVLHEWAWSITLEPHFVRAEFSCRY